MGAKVVCNICGKPFSKSGLVGHMKFKHARSVSHPMLPDESRPSGMLNEEALTCQGCGSDDMDAISLQGQLVRLEGKVEADNLVRDTRLLSKDEDYKLVNHLTAAFTRDAPGKLVAHLAEKAPAGKKFLKLKCRKCGAEKTISISVS